MIEWELGNRGATNAETLLNSLSRPNADLRARVESELERAEREHKQSILTRLSPDGVLAVDSSGQIIYSNHQITKLFGWTPEELKNRSLQILIPESIREAHIGYREAYQRRPKSRAMNAGLTLHGQHKDGSQIAVNISLAPISADGRQLTVASIREAVPVIAIDQPGISRPSMELFDALSTALFIMQSGRFLWANRACEQLLGNTEGRVLPGRSMEQFFPDGLCQFPDARTLEINGALELQDVAATTVKGNQLRLKLRFIEPPTKRLRGALLVEAWRLP